MNAKQIKNRIFKQSEISLDEIIVDKAHKSYIVTLLGGLTEYERQQMTIEQVNEYRKIQDAKIKELAQLFDNANILSFGISIRTI